MPAEIPHIIWSYWHSGTPPPVVQQCVQSWAVQAADWDVRFLNQTTALSWLLDGMDMPRTTWDQSPQNQAAMIGLALLRRYGGVWLDASVLLTQPLTWLLAELRGRPGETDFLGWESGTGSPEIFAYASRARGLLVDRWWSKLYVLWERCPNLLAAGCLERFAPQHARGSQWAEAEVRLHPRSVGQWVLENEPSARAAFGSLGLAQAGPTLLAERANERGAIAERVQLVSICSRLRLPLPEDVRACPLHRVAGAVGQRTAAPPADSWWGELLRLSQLAPPSRALPTHRPSRCNVVAEPLLGFGNRLRLLASAYIYAAGYGCAFFVEWRVTSHMPHTWAELFSTRLATPTFPYVRPPLTHTHTWLENVSPLAVDAVVFRGGHSFKLRSHGSSDYLRQKRAFLAALAPSAAVTARAIDTRGHLCFHYRQQHAGYDNPDLGPDFFSTKSPLDLFIRRMRQLPASRRVYVSSTSMEAKWRLRRSHATSNPRGCRMTWLQDAG